MKQSFLAVFEQSENNWSGFAPDVPATGGLGETLADARNHLREGIYIYMQEAAGIGLALPVATSTTVDFSEFDPDPENSRYVVEWLTLEMPEAVQSHPAHGLVGIA